MTLTERVIETLIEQGYEVRLTADFSGAIDFGRFRKTKNGQVNPSTSLRIDPELRENAVEWIKGFIFPDDLVILINKNLPLEERVITLIHELLHELFPKWGEIKIESTTQLVYRTLSPRQKQVIEGFISR